MAERITNTLDKLSSRKAIKYAVYASAVIIFFVLILLPPVLGIFIKWNDIQFILARPDLVGRSLNAIQNSFIIALTVAALDLLVGIPMAWLIARGKSRWLKVIDTLADIPFIIPTAALGYSLLLFWSKSGGVSALFGGSLVSPGWLLVMLLHFTFSFPVVVRVTVGALLDYKMEYERASRTLGAAPFTAVRTVTIPILRPAMISAYIFAFARSISETGATIVVAGVFENGSVFIQNTKNLFTAGSIDQATYNGALVFASFILITVSIAIFIAIRFLGPKLRLPLKRVRPIVERKLSYQKAEKARNTVVLIVFFALILIPSLFVALPAFQAVFTPTLSNALTSQGVWQGYWQSLVVSYGLGATVTVLNIIIGLPTAIIIARKKAGKFMSSVFDILVNIPLVVPSIALGVSLAIFWKSSIALPELVLLILAHLAITYPYFVRSMSAAVERIPLEMEEASRTLGAKPLGVFRTIILPLTKYSLFSGAIMVFTRSVSETGATLAVISGNSPLQTAPLLLVNWIKGVVSASGFDIALGAGFLILLSFIILLVLRLVVGREEKY